MTRREKTIAIAAGAALLALVGYSYVIQPYFDQRTELQATLKKAQLQRASERDLLENQPKVAADWKGLLATSLKTTPADAMSKTQDALFDWARSSNFSLQSVKPDRQTQAGEFQQIHLQASGTGSTAAISAWLWNIESSNLPLQIDEFRINTRKDGADDLTLTVGLTTLVFAPPPATRPAAKGRSSQAGDI